MGTRQSEQGSLWVAMAKLPKSPGHPFYARLSALLDAADFDRFVEEQCAKFYAPVMGRPSLAPGEKAAQDFEGYGIEPFAGTCRRVAHRQSSLGLTYTLMIKLSDASIDAWLPGGSTVQECSCSTIAGPSIVFPACRRPAS